MKEKLIKTAIAGGLFLLATNAFERNARYEIFRRDRGECQCPTCIGYYIQGSPVTWRDGWNMQAAHWPEAHCADGDRDTTNGRMLCTSCHLIEEIERGNDRGADLLHSGHTIRNHGWLNENRVEDPKPPLSFYYDWVESDELGRQGLAQIYMERWATVPVQMSLI